MKKKRISIVLSILLILLVVAIYFYLNDKNRLTSEERTWVSDNQTKVNNVYVLNNANIFGKNGNGIYYSFIKDFEDKYSLKLNPIIINGEEEPSDLALNVGNSEPTNGFTFYKDHYVLISKSEKLLSGLNKITSEKIGVLSSSLNYIKNYYNYNYETYDNLSTLFNALESGDLTYAIVPRIETIDTILSKKYTINYHLSDLIRYYYVSSPKEDTYYNVINKFYNTWKNDFENNLYQEELKIFKDNLNISDSELSTLQKDNLTYAYKQVMPYEVGSRTSYSGILGVYLNKFSKFTGIEIDFKKYNNDNSIVKDINNKKIDLISNIYNLSDNGELINTSLFIKAGVYTKESNIEPVSSLYSLKDKVVYAEDNTYLLSKLSSLNCIVKPIKYDNIGKISRENNAIIILDKKVGEDLQKTYLNEYLERFTIDLNANYQIRSFSDDKVNKLLKYYINYLDTVSTNYQGLKEAVKINKDNFIFGSIARYVIYLTIITAVIIFIIYRSSKKVRLHKKIKKDNKLKYVDQLTSLKNRNYLNENISTWNKNTIYPQGVIVIDLSKIKEINDKNGYSSGDKQITSCASILIKTQLDNTDIIRTDGNEFMIYLVGYNQKQITSYVHKLYKEFKNLPYGEDGYGARISYSMILSDTKSIEDALNECTTDILNQKKKEEENENS